MAALNIHLKQFIGEMILKNIGAKTRGSEAIFP